METLRNLLKSLANINLCIARLQRQDIAHAIQRRIKDASSLCSTDLANVADFIDQALGYDNLSEQDVKVLRVISHNLRNANQHLQLTQNLILSA